METVIHVSENDRRRKDFIDLKCPVCGEAVKNICFLTVDWMVEQYCREYLRHVDECRMRATVYPGSTTGPNPDLIVPKLASAHF